MFNCLLIAIAAIAGAVVAFLLGRTTASNQATKAARDAQDSILATLEGLPVGVYREDRSGNIVFANQSLVSMSGLKVEDANGLGWLRIIHPDDVATVWAYHEETLRTRQEQAIEYRCLTAEGEYRWTRCRRKPQFSESGEFEGWIGTIENIQGKKTAELRNLALLAEHATDSICGLNLDGQITEWNLGAEQLYGYKRKEVLGRELSAIFPAQHLEEIYMLVFDAQNGKHSNSTEMVALNKDGTHIEIQLVSSPIWDENQIVGVSLISRDITKRREAEKRVAEFYSVISHELRTPLTSISGALTLVDSGIVDLNSAEANELIKIAKQSSEQLMSIINDILDLRKIETGKLELNLSTVMPEKMIDNAIQSMSGLGLADGISIRKEINCHEEVRADQYRTVQVISNLLSNAMKFSEPGAEILLSVNRTDSQKVRFSVVDTGAGIPLHSQHKLFGKFQQIDSSDKRQKGGSGLGLHICKSIVEGQNGRIGFESFPGKGSTFWFELDLAEANVLPTDGVKPPTIAPVQESAVREFPTGKVLSEREVRNAIDRAKKRRIASGEYGLNPHKAFQSN